MAYQQSIDHCFSQHARHGVAKTQFESLLPKLAPMLKLLQERKHAAAHLNLPSRTDDLLAMETLATHIRARFKHVVVVGSGGSGLSGRTLTHMLLDVGTPTFDYLDNIDPDAMDAVLARRDLAATCFVIISKSGNTAETLSQFFVLLEQVEKKLGKQAVAGHFFVITMPGASLIRSIAGEHGIAIHDHDLDIGGRFSILTNVGLLPAAIAGLDIKALRRGAQSVVAQMDKSGEPSQCAPAVGAALQQAFALKNHPMNVILPYGERLGVFTLWYRQCWAESLGKQGKGTTPIPAQGSTDQHSQLQLYLDGPRDKLFTMLLLDRANKGERIHAPDKKELAYLRGKTLGDVMQAEQRATFETLVQNGCPVRLISLPELDEETMGALLMHFMLEIMFMAALLEIDPFDQPAVEQGKELARQYLLAEKS